MFIITSILNIPSTETMAMSSTVSMHTVYNMYNVYLYLFSSLVLYCMLACLSVSKFVSVDIYVVECHHPHPILINVNVVNNALLL